MFVCNPRKLKLRQVRQLDPLRRLEEELERVYLLTQDFRTMVTLRCSPLLGPWLTEVKRSRLPELRSFAAGIYRDYDAVWAALTTPYSNGQTEAQVHRLKLIKRLGYGRASFDLLSLRVLHRSGGRISENAYEPVSYRSLQPFQELSLRKPFSSAKKHPSHQGKESSLFLARAVFLTERAFPACYFALHDSFRDIRPIRSRVLCHQESYVQWTL